MVRVVPTSSLECTKNTISMMVRYGGGRGNMSIFTSNDKVSTVEDLINYDYYHSLSFVYQLHDWFRDLVTYGVEGMFGYRQ